MRAISTHLSLAEALDQAALPRAAIAHRYDLHALYPRRGDASNRGTPSTLAHSPLKGFADFLR
jgi:hypothetical protein